MSGYEFVQRGKVLIVKKQYQDAVKVCRLGLLAHPTLVEGRLVLGMALMALGRYDEVLAEMRVALELDRASPLGHLLKGEALFRKGDLRQAAEVLQKAKDLDPLNDKVSTLLDEVRRARDGAGRPAGRLSPPSSFVDNPETKAYPAHRGAQLVSQDPVSGSVTLPAEVAPRPAAGAARGASAVPPPEVLAVGDQSATIMLASEDLQEIASADPEATVIGAEPESPAMIEIASRDLEEASSDDLEVPVPRATVPGARPAFGGRSDDLDATLEDEDPQPTFERQRPGGARRDESGESYVEVDLSSGAHEPAGGPDPALGLIEPDDYDEPPVEGDYEESAARSRRIVRALTQDGAAALDPPTAPEKVGARKSKFGTGESTTPETPRASGVVARRPARAAERGQPSSLFIDDDELESTSPEPVEVKRPSPAAARRPQAPPGAAPRPAPSSASPPAAAPAPTVARAGSVSPAPAPAAARAPASRRGATATAATGGPTPAAVTTTPTAAVSSTVRPRTDATGRTRERRRSQTLATPMPRRGFGALYLAVVAVVIVLAAIGAGLAVREARFKRAVRKNLEQAGQLAGEQTYRGYLVAQCSYRRVLRERDQREARTALARASAAMAAELGEPADEARDLLSRLEGDASRDVVCARVYLALADDGREAVRGARDAVSRFAQDPEAAYLLGRALLHEGDPAAAATELRRSVDLGASPMAYVFLGRALAELGKTDEALAALDSALELVPSHPAATIERARLYAQSGRLPQGGQPEAELNALVRQGPAEAQEAWRCERGGDPPLLSRAQTGWAWLALAEVKLARGDEAGARSALGSAARARPVRDRLFSDALTAALIAAGDLSTARAEAEAAVVAWPADGTPRVWLARIALAEGRPKDAVAELDRAGAAGARPDALAVRGQARLALGDVEGAARDLDEALATQPEDRTILLARAAVDLRRGDARAAAARLGPLYDARPDPEVGVVYGAALRLLNDPARARAILEKAAGSPRGRGAWLELARLNRDQGRHADARDAYARAIEVTRGAVEPRLEAATLAYDDGDAAGARRALDALVADAPADAEVLLECARLRVAGGDLEGASKCLTAASGVATAPAWKVAREKGRLLLAQRRPKDAVVELKKAAAAWANDAETRLLLIDASLALDDSVTTQDALADVLKRFAGRPEADLARGRVHLGYGRSKEAVQAFAAADKALQAASAPRRVLADARTWLGRAQHSEGDLAKARQSFEEATKLDPSSADPYYFLGLVYYEQDQMPQARAAFEQAVTLNPNHADAWFYLGEAARRMGDRPRSKEAYLMYLKLAPRGDLAPEARRLSQ